MIESLPAANFADLSFIRHGFYTRNGGVSEGLYASLNAGLSSADDQTKVRENRRRIAVHLGADPDRFLSCFQVHSPDVVTVTSAWAPEDRPHADAMVTNEKGIALGILTADCGPVLFVDPEAKVIGAAHAGWRGAVAGVLENTIAAMEALGAHRTSIRAALGPCIWQDNYEVGPEFPPQFLAENPANARFFKPSTKADHAMFDLPSYILDRLTRAGITNIAPSVADTYADEARFFSFRRNTIKENIKRAASLVSVLMLD